ncbi:MAG: methyltransferase [Rhizobiaceae bacterium]|nr:methyltransferase [Rhizobiaceae bacterium]
MGGSLPHGRRDAGALRPYHDATAFILANTAELAPPHVPEVRLRLADEAHVLWQQTEEELAATGLPPPFWAFAWAGGQGLARYVLDHPATVEGQGVLDFASGSGLVAIAAAMAGAAHVEACDIDPFALAAITLNGRINNVRIEATGESLVGADRGWDVVLAGDVFYDQALANALTPWFRTLRARGAAVFVGDPGRYYLPRDGLEAVETYQVPVTRALEDSEVKRTTVWRFA